MANKIRVWQIGPDGTEYYAAHSEEEMKAWYLKILGNSEEAQGDLANDFTEIYDLDTDMPFDDDGEKTTTTWRKLAEGYDLPCQISTGYN